MVNGQVEQYLSDHQIRDLENIRKRLAFTKIDEGLSESVLLIKDIALSEFPHNLLLNTNDDFISRIGPITGILSAEWYIENVQKEAKLDRDFTTSMWIPTDAGDLALNLLLSKLTELIEIFPIKVSTSELPETPLESDVNILVAHGASDIAEFHSVFTTEKGPITELGSVVGSGRIAVLFVCHSGSMKKALLRDTVLSLVRIFIGNGYQAVVAPFWSLHTSVPPVWLPEFLISIKKGNPIAQAVFDANSKVFDLNKNPGAWACLHLYGNPHLNVLSRN